MSAELELTLTGRDCGQAERAPMCGVPYHSAESYIARLVAKGYKVAICEQLETPAQAKGLVKRDIVRVITRVLLWKAVCWMKQKTTLSARFVSKKMKREFALQIFLQANCMRQP